MTNPAATTCGQSIGGFFAELGRGVGRAALAAHGSVDPDARRDLLWMPVVGLASLGARSVPPKAIPADGFRPVLFVHGLAGYRGNFTAMRSWMKLQGRGRTYSVGLAGRTIPEMADELDAYIDELVQVNRLPDGSQIDVVAHSMGGLVSRLALRTPRTARRVHTLVTLGTPHQGTHAARFTGGALMGGLRHDSGLMARLESDHPWDRATRLVCFWSASDPLMQPARTATVLGADNREVVGFSHLDWLMRRKAWMDVAAVLRE